MKRKTEMTIYTAASALRARERSGLGQAEFWRRLGVTQSGGSRYERGIRRIPKPVNILLNISQRKTVTMWEIVAAVRNETL